MTLFVHSFLFCSQQPHFQCYEWQLLWQLPLTGLVTPYSAGHVLYGTQHTQQAAVLYIRYATNARIIHLVLLST